MRSGTLTLTVCCLLLISGCANLNPMPKESEQLQKEAIARWQRCLDNHADKPVSRNMDDAAKELHSRCEGHRRDVLLSFPATLEPHLDHLLLKQTMKSAFSALNETHHSAPDSPLLLPSASAIRSIR